MQISNARTRLWDRMLENNSRYARWVELTNRQALMGKCLHRWQGPSSGIKGKYHGSVATGALYYMESEL